MKDFSFVEGEAAGARLGLEEVAVVGHVEFAGKRDVPGACDVFAKEGEFEHFFGDGDVHGVFELHDGEGIGGEAADEGDGNFDGAFVREARKLGEVVAHEGGGEAFG